MKYVRQGYMGVTLKSTGLNGYVEKVNDIAWI